jgi:RNA polymerase sigma-70 factor, ECF subfamily
VGQEDPLRPGQGRGAADHGVRLSERGADTGVVDRLFRHESGRAVATLIRVLGDFDAAEEAVQEAFVIALERWPADGLPDNPGAWITRVARNRAIDRLRRESRLREKNEILAGLEALEPASEEMEPEMEETEPDIEPQFPDDRLRLIFTCCHPAIAPEARVALTLRTLGGLTTSEIASAFLASESATAQRMVRAKKKIRDARIPYEVPSAEHLPERLPSVLATLYLIFNEGYYASSADSLVRTDLAAEAIRLTRVLDTVMPGVIEVRGLLALMLLQDSRREARVDEEGSLVLLSEQDRSRWDAAMIEEGLELTAAVAWEGTDAGRYALQAAIAAEHARAERAQDTDWQRIVSLYDRLADVQPSPVVALNRAVAVGEAAGADAGLAALEGIEGIEELDDYQPMHATRADLLRRTGRTEEARGAYERALELSANPVQREFLERRLAELA